MKKFFCTLITIIVLTITTAAVAAPKPKPLDPDQVVKDAIAHFMKKYHVPGAAVVLYIHNRAYTYYFGYANKKTKKPVDNKTLFELGSLTKLFTTLLLAEQIDANKMHLLDLAARYFPELQQGSKQFSQVHLLNLATHTAGFSLDLPGGVNSQQDLMNYLKGWHSDLSVGKQWSYSNIGIGLLGDAIVNATGESYQQLLNEEILQELGMQHTYIDIPANEINNLAQGYNESGQPAPRVVSELFPAAWALKSTLPDMQRFLSASIHISGTPYSISHALRIAQTPYFALKDMQQGLAWQVYRLNPKTMNDLLNPPTTFDISAQPARFIIKIKRQYNGKDLIDKTGATDGFRAYLAVIPAKKSGIIILANRYVANGPVVKVGREILFKLVK